MNEDVYLDIHDSLIRFCTTFIDENFPNKFTTVNFDAHTTLNELPEGNVIGTSKLVLTENQELYEGVVSLQVMTTADDDNLKELLAAISRLFYATQTGSEIQVVDNKTGEAKGRLVIKEGTTVSAVARNEARPIQGVFVSFGAAFTSPP